MNQGAGWGCGKKSMLNLEVSHITQQHTGLKKRFETMASLINLILLLLACIAVNVFNIVFYCWTYFYHSLWHIGLAISIPVAVIIFIVYLLVHQLFVEFGHDLR